MLRTPITSKRVMTNIEDTKSLKSYSHYLIMKAQLSGNLCFDGHIPSQEERQIAEQCRRVCERISQAIDFCKVSDVPELLDYYDMAYRIGNKCLPDSTLIKKQKQRVFKAWKEGDQEIAESAIYGMLLPEIRFSKETADKNYSAAINSIKGKWINTLKEYGRFPKTTTYENYRRLSYMMRENLDRELDINAERAKHKWYELNKIDDLTIVSSLILIAYRRFATSLFPTVLDYDSQIAIDNRLLRELSTREDLVPYDREAFRMAMEYNRVIMQ